MDDGDDVAGAENNAATCRLFCHDVARTAHDEGAQLPGTNFRLHPYQMEAVYEQLQRSFGEGRVAVMRLTELNTAVVRLDARITSLVPDRAYNEPGTTTACPSNNPWGIECCCVSGSLTDHIIRDLAPGPSLVLMPANVVEQFARQGSAYLVRVIQLPGSASHMSFIDTIDTSTVGASLANEVQADIFVDFVGERPEYSAPKTGKPPALVPGSGSEIGCEQLLKAVMSRRMSNGLFHSKALLRLSEIYAVTVACRSERVEEGDFRRRMDELRE
ncbi:hypothetical protein C8A05DRAFT_36832, partial [Staphylotrichum tortipilum]